MRIRLRGINRATKRLADGTRRTYWYAWKGGPPLRGEPGSPEFVASYNAAVATKIAPPTRRVARAAVSLSGERRISIWNFAAHPPRLHQADKAHRARLRRFPDQGAGRSEIDVGVSRMARQAGANIAAAGRLCLWHFGAHSFLGTQSRTDCEEPVRQGRQALSRHPRQQDLARRGSLALPANRAALSSAGDAARNQHRTTARRSIAPALERL